MSDRAVFAALGAFVALVAAQRLGELILSARHARRLAARGGREVAAAHFPLLVALHVLFPLTLVGEVVLLGARPGPWSALWVALWVLAQALRVAAIRALGDRWNVRIWVVPGETRVRRGPYRWLAHPNYLAVAVELLAGPMIFGAWRTALAFSALNALALRVRIRAEERALSDAEAAAAPDAGAAGEESRFAFAEAPRGRIMAEAPPRADEGEDVGEDEGFRFTIQGDPEGRFMPAAEAERRLLAATRDRAPETPEHRAARLELMRFYGVEGRIDEALTIMGSLIEDEPDAERKAVVALVAAACVEDTGDYPAAVELYRRVLSFDPREPDTAYFGHNNLAYSLNQLGAFDEGETEARAAIAVDAERHNAHKNLGVALEGRGRMLDAARAYLAAVHAEAGDPRALEHLEAMVLAHPDVLESDPRLAEEIARCREAVATALAARLDGRQN